MADKVELKSSPPVAPEGTKVLEAVTQPGNGNTAKVTVDTTQTEGSKGDPAKPEEKATAERPAWLPEEFKTPEEFAEAYKKSKAPEAKVEPKQAEEAVQKAGLDMAALQQEFAAQGKLSDDSISKLEKAGVSKAQLDSYIAGQKAQAQLYVQSLEQSVGGVEELQATLKWAETGLSKAEIDLANKALSSGDEAQAKLVLSGLHSRRLQANGREPTLIGGRTTKADSVVGYESNEQWVKDVNTKEYRTDPAFRDRVAKRVAASKF